MRANLDECSVKYVCFKEAVNEEGLASGTRAHFFLKETLLCGLMQLFKQTKRCKIT